MPAKNMPGRKAGEDHARSQGPLRGEAFVGSTLSLAAIIGPLFLSVQRIFRSQSADAGQFRLRRAKEPLKAGRWVEHGPAGKDQRAACRGERLFALLIN